MTIILNGTQVNGDKPNVKNSLNIAYLDLRYEEFNQIIEHKEKTFNILIIKKTPILLKRCVKCAWRYEELYTHMQINYWESEIVQIDSFRDILIDKLLSK
jgi:hypothetical protein